jgi:monoamine oxidase
LLPPNFSNENNRMSRTLDFKRLCRWILAETPVVSSAGSPSVPASLPRREFLGKTAMGGLASAAFFSSACSTLDRWVMGDSTRIEGEILVLGGGLAGLCAAYHLKKNRVPYRLFEASSRLGGRVQTLEHFNSDQQFAEAGAEFFEGSHRELAQLCQELNLKIQNISYDPKVGRGLYWLDGKIVAEKEFRKALRPLALKLAQLRGEILSSVSGELQATSLAILPQAQEADRNSLANVIEPFRDKIPKPVLETFENLCISEWGVETSDINLLHFLVKLSLEDHAASVAPAKLLRIEGGNSKLVQILGERVQGVLAGFSLKLEHQVVELQRRAGGYNCTFKTPKGHETIWARQVICTLPWSILKDVEGLRNLELPKPQVEAIENAFYAKHAKSICSYKEPVWKHRKADSSAFQGNFRGQLLGQSYWDSSRGQTGTHGLLTSQSGGKKSQALTPELAATECLLDLRRFFKEQSPEENSHLTKWENKPFAKGSRHCSRPGTYLKHLEMLTVQDEKTGFFFAGEHMSFRDAGTMNGAVKTAVDAANEAMRRNHVKTVT